MPRCLAAAIIVCVGLPTPARAQERYLDFIKALQDGGYADIAIEYAEQLRGRAGVPEEVRAATDYVIGKSLMIGAELLTDLGKRQEHLQEARKYLDKFIREQPQHSRIADAHLDLAQLLVERGRLALLHANNPNNQDRRLQFQQEARGFMDDARKSFTAARDQFLVEFKKFAAYIPETDKREREAKDLARHNVMQAQLHLGMVLYEQAQAYDKASPDRRRTLEEAAAIFRKVHEEYRVWLAGQYARLWQGKCFEEMGDLTRAEGIYRELLEHEDRDRVLQALQRQTQYFLIIVLNQRGDYVLAVDMARKWLQEYSSFRRTETGIGVLFEQAQAQLQQALARPEKNAERDRLLAQAMFGLDEVARFATIHRQPAIVLQQKYKGLAGSKAGTVMSFERARALAEAAREAKKWPEAATNYSQALRLAKDDVDLDQLAYVRQALGFCSYQMKDFYQSAVLGEYVARRQSQATQASGAGSLAMAAYAAAYNEVQARGQAPDFEAARLMDLGDHMIRTWPDSKEASDARYTLHELHLSRGQYEEAAGVLESAPPTAPDYAKLLTQAGETYWRGYVDGATRPPEDQDPAQLTDFLKRARAALDKGVAEQFKGLKPEAAVPRELAQATLDLADAWLESGEPAEAVKQAQQIRPKIIEQQELEPLKVRVLVCLLRGQIMTNDLAGAQATRRAIELAGSDLAYITRVYLDLGKRLQEEMERLRARGDTEALRRTRESYIRFLDELKNRQGGQSFVTLQWTGEAFLGLEMYREAADRFEEIIRQVGSDPEFLDPSKSQDQAALQQVKLRLVTALRKQELFSQAWKLIKPLPKESNQGDDPLHRPAVLNYDIIMERGLVLQEWGFQDATKLKTAIDHWALWAQKIEPMPQKPPQYFEIRLDLIRCMRQQGRKSTDSKERDKWLRQAEQQWLFMTKTNPQLGGPALKAQYDQVRKELEKDLGRTLGSPVPAEPKTKPVAK